MMLCPYCNSLEVELFWESGLPPSYRCPFTTIRFRGKTLFWCLPGIGFYRYSREASLAYCCNCKSTITVFQPLLGFKECRNGNATSC